MLARSSDIRRDVFFFPSQGLRLYGSLYAAPGLVRFGAVVSPSIGLEASQSLDPAHALASAVAELGGAGMVLHPPGSLDSSGDPAELTLDAFTGAVRDAGAELRARETVGDLWLIGFRFGAAAAALAAAELAPSVLTMLSPTRDPAAAIGELRRDAARATLGRGGATDAFGHTLPPALADAGDGVRIESAMEAAAERLIVVDFAEPPGRPVPAGAEVLVVPGAMGGFRVRWAAHLARAAEPALRRRRDVVP